MKPNRYTLNDLTLERWITGPVQENAFFLFDANKQGFIIDPGDDGPMLLARIREIGMQPRAILLTHAHFDHIGAVQLLRTELGIPVWLHAADMPIYLMGALSALKWGVPFEQPEDPDAFLTDGQILECGNIRLEVRLTPGHAPGHVVFVGSGFAISGDTLFKGSVGRTDLPLSDTQTLLSSIQKQLLTLPDDTLVFPGHGSETSIGLERQHNRFLQPLDNVSKT
ncbi:MAG: MBL fold metallo-hydrolase [Deinococcaceae bacterium]